jgi:hypothetical protein
LRIISSYNSRKSRIAAGNVLCAKSAQWLLMRKADKGIKLEQTKLKDRDVSTIFHQLKNAALTDGKKYQFKKKGNIFFPVIL